MNLNITNFKLKNSSTGNIHTSGKKNINNYSHLLSYKTLLNTLQESNKILGMPQSILQPQLINKSHLGNTIQITKNINDKNNNTIYIPDRLRITYISGITSAKNSILYGFSSKSNESHQNIKWKLLFANCLSQSYGDYIDIDLPDSTKYPKLFLHIILLLNGFNYIKKINNNHYNFTNRKYYFYNNNHNLATKDIKYSHAINIKAYNNFNAIATRILVAFEDWAYPRSDADYNDVVLSISSVFFDDNIINEQILK